MRIFLFFFLFLSVRTSAQIPFIKKDSSLVIIHVSKSCGELAIRFTLQNRNTMRCNCNHRNPGHFILKNSLPAQFSFGFLDKGFNGLILPSDTLIINIDFDINGNYLNTFRGKSELCCNYYQFLNHDTVFKKLKQLSFDSSKDIVGKLAKIDTITRYNKEYLNSYIKDNSLPDWFIQFENRQILYFDALQKLKAISLYNLNYNKKIFLNPQYLVWISDATIDNPEAIEIPAYFEFLQVYFSLFNKGLNNSGISSRVFNHFVQTIPEVRKQLKSEVFDYYMAYTISEYYKNGAIREPLDSLLLSLKPEFRNAELYNTLVNNM